MLASIQYLAMAMCMNFGILMTGCSSNSSYCIIKSLASFQMKVWTSFLIELKLLSIQQKQETQSAISHMISFIKRADIDILYSIYPRQ